MYKWLNLTLISLVNLLLLVKCVHNISECNFKRFSDGCEDSYGTYCNRTGNVCQCRPGFTVKIENFCLPPKNFSDSCFVSEQCRTSRIPSIGCYIDDREIDVKTLRLWINTDSVFKIIGTCTCPPTHYFNATRECTPKRDVNDYCAASQECLSIHSYCDQSSRQCKCKPTFRYSVRKKRCVSQLIGENCSDTDHCVVHDPNAECRIGSCQCRPGFILSHSGRCTIVRIRGTSNHLLMMLVVVATAVVFALLSTAHRKWSSAEDLLGTGARNRNQIPLNSNWITRRTFPTTHNMVFPNTGGPNQAYPVPLSVPSLALIWPLRHGETDVNQIYLEEGPPSYDEAINQSLRLSDINAFNANNSLTVGATAGDGNGVGVGNNYHNSDINSDNNNNINTAIHTSDTNNDNNVVNSSDNHNNAMNNANVNHNMNISSTSGNHRMNTSSGGTT